MKLSVLTHQVRLGADEFRVVRPARPLPRAVLLDRDRYLHVSVDRDAALSIAGLWMLAARSPRSLIHLPVRVNPLPAGDVPDGASRQLDLVLLHHSLQFAPSRWKQVRSRLGPGRPQTVSLPESERDQSARIDYEARHYRENRDLFHQHLHAETLFMTGSAKVFRETARHFLDVAGTGPGRTPAHPGDLALKGLYSPRPAAERLRTAINGHTPGFARSRAFSRTKLSSLTMVTGDPQEAVVIANRALDEVGRLRSRRAAEDLRELFRHATHHSKQLDVAELRHRITTALA
ncbi:MULTISPECIES: hypothetical protein [Streptomyces]|uniref:hypothetical protein n=1 Tax=Streptomyces TaxID=1883 RepID=UPI00345C2253